MHKVVTTDLSISANVVEINSDISRIDTNHGRDGKWIPMKKIHGVPETNMRYRKSNYDSER